MMSPAPASYPSSSSAKIQLKLNVRFTPLNPAAESAASNNNLPLFPLGESCLARQHLVVQALLWLFIVVCLFFFISVSFRWTSAQISHPHWWGRSLSVFPVDGSRNYSRFRWNEFLARYHSLLTSSAEILKWHFLTGSGFSTSNNSSVCVKWGKLSVFVDAWTLLSWDETTNNLRRAFHRHRAWGFCFNRAGHDFWNDISTPVPSTRSQTTM